MKTSRRSLSTAILTAALGICGCATDRGSDVPHANDGMDAVLWVQSSTEYAASTIGIYSAAAEQLERIAAANPEGVDRMAVVMDVDETVLDNSPYQGQMVLDGTSYKSESWDRWIALRDARAVPGVIEFIRASQALGVQVMFVTNRACRTRPDSAERCPQKLDTLFNLRNLGIDAQTDALFLRGDLPPEHCRDLLSESERPDGRWSSDKTSRRQCVAADYEIIMLFGDQLGDFTAESADGPAQSHRGSASDIDRNWGRSWFMLPNPTYGDWLPNDTERKRAAVRGID